MIGADHGGSHNEAHGLAAGRSPARRGSDRIKAEAENGWFGLLPKHIDFVTALVPGVMTFQPGGRPEEYLAIDHGILVKCGPEVSVSTRNAVRGTEPGSTEEGRGDSVPGTRRA